MGSQPHSRANCQSEQPDKHTAGSEKVRLDPGLHWFLRTYSHGPLHHLTVLYKYFIRNDCLFPISKVAHKGKEA
jgi:hypothetical protein